MTIKTFDIFLGMFVVQQNPSIPGLVVGLNNMTGGTEGRAELG
jgi:hypothetical protein